MSACYSAAAANADDQPNCGSTCPSSCSAYCANGFSNVVKADDGLPDIPQPTPESTCVPPAPGFQRAVCYSPGDAREYNPGEPSYPDISGGQYIDGPGITNNGEPIESDMEPEGVTTSAQGCPARAPDGHPMRWNEYMGCYDPYWKNDYCIVATGCNTGPVPCSSRQGCIWNGAQCVPCNSPSCNYRCGGTGAQAGAPAAAAAPIIAKQAQLPTPREYAAELAAATPLPAGATPRPVYVAPPTPTPYATTYPTPEPTPVPFDCTELGNCTACTDAPQKDSKSQCGWSDSLGACIDGDIWGKVNASGLKPGFLTEQKYCREEPDAYCFQYSDCFSCAGDGGVKRRCQWSLKMNSCVPYDPTADFKTPNNTVAKNVILPAMCKAHDCSQYSDCRACENNAACLYSKEDDKCVPYKGGKTDGYYFFPSNCPANASATPVPTPTPVPCPKDCKCDDYNRVLTCGGKPANASLLVHVDRALANAGAASPMQLVDSVSFNPSTDAPTYTVQGHRESLMFFFFPVEVGVTATIDAKTGAVKEVRQPWWAFLAG
ncbi:MAG: hypothetical protein V1708_04995 [Candidatus Micrarchaeota archaeon]